MTDHSLANFQEKWLPIELELCPSFILEKLGAAKVKEILRHTVKENFQFCTDPKFVEAHYKYCKIEGSSVNDFLFRQLATPLGNIITSIRFVGGDLTKPFVFIISKDFDFKNAVEIKEMGVFLKNEYALFKPQRLRWYSPQLETELIDKHDWIAGDLIYITAFIEDLKKKDLPKNSDQIELRLATSLDWYATYEQGYNDLLESWPEYEEMGQLEDKETLNTLLVNNWLFEIFIQGEWAGIIGVNKDFDNFMNGYVIYEEFLLAPFRGKGYAAAIQRQMLERLPCEEQEQLYGTIHAGNIPSLKTALRVGREVVGMFVFAEV